MRTAYLRRQSDEGFSLVELLTVIIIIGVLASIAIPLYLDQQKKGHDAATKTDLNALAIDLAAFVTENETLPVVAVADRTVTLDGANSVSLSPGVALGTLHGTDIEDWCIDATHPAGDRAKAPGYRFTSIDQKVEEGQCP